MPSLRPLLSLCLLFPVILTGCNASAPNAAESPNAVMTLKERYADFFLVGATADLESYITHSPLLKNHFSSMTTENAMKFEQLQNIEGEFTFETADNMINFARENGLSTRGHALVWHRQTPDWLFNNSDGKPVSKDELLSKMRAHITTVVSHFKGRIEAWDVVNEAIMDDGTMRTHTEEADDQKSAWYGIAGEEYIAEAFHTAHAADPKAKLFYNDYYNYIPARQQAIFNLLQTLLNQDVPVHGVGLQAHINTIPSNDPNHQSSQQSVKNLEKAIQLYASLGLEVHITEMDVSLYIGGFPYTEKDYYTEASIPESLKLKQAERYAAFFEMFRRNSDIIASVTLWGIADDNTWLSEFDSGRADFPLLFDTQHQPKKAFDAIMNF